MQKKRSGWMCNWSKGNKCVGKKVEVETDSIQIIANNYN